MLLQEDLEITVCLGNLIAFEKIARVFKSLRRLRHRHKRGREQTGCRTLQDKGGELRHLKERGLGRCAPRPWYRCSGGNQKVMRPVSWRLRGVLMVLVGI